MKKKALSATFGLALGPCLRPNHVRRCRHPPPPTGAARPATRPPAPPPAPRSRLPTPRSSRPSARPSPSSSTGASTRPLEDAPRDRLHPERSPGRLARDRTDRRLGRLRRSRPLRRRVLSRLRPVEDPQAPRPPRRADRLRLVHGRRRSLLRQALGLRVLRQPGRLDHRRRALERRQRRRLVGRRLGEQGRGQRRRLDDRDAHPLQPDPLPEERRLRLGRQLPPHDPAQERAVELQLEPQDRRGDRVAVRAARRPPGHQPGRARRVHAVHGRTGPAPAVAGRQSVRDRAIAPSATPASISRSASRAT